ncbi:MAG: ribosome small subunit-dependent GTPase A [Planctomycetes bacterium]|nr:ribosome small subunit-dependent GTPase A [Planctomycetota bacterium]
MSGKQGKYKGVKGHNQRQGMGRLRRANTSDPGRVGGYERHDEDAEIFDRLGSLARASHGGESLLAKFNRLAGIPEQAGGERGEICGFAGTLTLVRAAAGAEVPCSVRQVLKKRVKGVKNPLCVGDLVTFERAADGSGVIDAVAPRRNQLERADSHNRSLIHVFASNIDALVVVSSLHEPDIKLGLIDRYLLIAAANRIPACLVINKSDLGDPSFALTLYRGIGIPCFATIATGTGDSGPDLAALREHLHGKACVIAGQSGVGKSSLVNTLFPGTGARVGVVADAGHGRHTTTSSRSYLMPDGARLIDTPGVRECSITGLVPLDVSLLYPDIAAFHQACHFKDCTHLHEPECAVRTAVEDGRIADTRYDSYCSIILEDLVM